MNEAQRRRFEQLRADQHLIEQAAEVIRHESFQGEYAGFHRKELALGVAAVFDMLALQLREVPEGVRAQAVASATRIIAAPRSPGGATAGSAGPGPARALTPTAATAAMPIGGVTRDRTCSESSSDGAGSPS